MNSKILKFLLFLMFTSNTNCYVPLEDKGDASSADTAVLDTRIIQLQKDVNIVSYIQNFKNIMAEYVNSQYRNLTINEMERVKHTLEEFLTNFAKDLKEVVEKQKEKTDSTEDNTDYEKINDDISDATFDDIKNRVRAEFPDIAEKTAKEIVYKLRKNLFMTRKKIDTIIKESEIAQFENSQH